MNVLVTCKYEDDTIKNRGARVFTTLYVNFSDAQGQITLKSVVVSGRNLNSSKLSCMSLLPARIRMIKSKMKELECSQDFSNYKSMGIFPDAQGQLTAQGQITIKSVVVSGRNLNSSKLSCMSLLPARMRMIESKMKELECSQDFSHYVYGDFSRRSRAANSAVLNQNWPKFELVRDIMVVLVTCKYEEDPIKNEGASVFTTFSPL